MSDIDAEIAEFHRAARRRKAWIFGIAGTLSIALGIAILAVWYSSIEPQYHYGEGRVLFGGIAFVLSGLGMAWNAYRIGSGRINDVD